jgi:hypothetical protein
MTIPYGYLGSVSGTGGTVGTPSFMILNGTSSYAECGTDSSLVDLPLAAFTLEMYFNWDDGAYQALLSKIIPHDSMLGGWHWEIYDAKQLKMQIINNAGTGWSNSESVETPTPGQWTHLVATYKTSDKKVYFAIDGVWCTYAHQDAFSGTYDTDATYPFRIGRWYYLNTFDMTYVSQDYLDGHVGWIRVSTGNRYTIGSNFTPPSRTTIPVVDGTTVEIWGMTEGSGTSIAATVDSGNNGTLTDVTWGTPLTGNTTLECEGLSTVSVQVSGTIENGSKIYWEGTVDGTNWEGVLGWHRNTGVKALSASATGLYVIEVTGLFKFRARFDSETGTTATVYVRATSLPEQTLVTGS